MRSFLLKPSTFLALSGALLYGLLRLCAIRFYGQFNIRPEDVGLGYGELLIQSAAAWLALLIVPIAAIVGFFGLAWIIGKLVPHVLCHLTRGLIRLRVPSRTTQWLARLTFRTRRNDVAPMMAAVAASAVLPTLLSAYVAYGAGSFWKKSAELASAAQSGKPIYASFEIRSLASAHGLRTSVNGLFENPLGLHAERVRVFPVSASAALEPLKLGERRSLLYLGESDGTIFLFDHVRDETLRLPAGTIALCIPAEVSGRDAKRANAATKQGHERAPCRP